MNIFVCCLVAGLLLLILHWLPWEKLLGRSLPRLAEFTLGMSGILMPVSVTILWAKADSGQSLVLIWSTMASGCLAMLLGYWVDDWADKRARAIEAETREETLEEQIERMR